MSSSLVLRIGIVPPGHDSPVFLHNWKSSTNIIPVRSWLLSLSGGSWANNPRKKKNLSLLHWLFMLCHLAWRMKITSGFCPLNSGWSKAGCWCSKTQSITSPWRVWDKAKNKLMLEHPYINMPEKGTKRERERSRANKGWRWMPELSWPKACWFSWDGSWSCSACAALSVAGDSGSRLSDDDHRRTPTMVMGRRQREEETRPKRGGLGRSCAGLKRSCLRKFPPAKSVCAWSFSFGMLCAPK